MVRRRCPECGRNYYSSASHTEWTCECGNILTKQLNEEAFQHDLHSDGGKDSLQQD